jgi:hypothetical protein
VLEQLDDGELEAFRDVAYTIGGFMVFPGNQIGRKWTINTAGNTPQDCGSDGPHP